MSKKKNTLTITQDGITVEEMENAVKNLAFASKDIGVTIEEMALAVKNLGDTIKRPLIPPPFDLYADDRPVLKEDNTPKEFHPLLCTRCGGNLTFKDDLLVCDYCGTAYSSNINIEEKKKGE